MQTVSDEAKAPGREIASPGMVAWRTRHLVAVLLVAGLILVGLALVASQANPDAIDVGVTLWIQQFQHPAFAALMYWVSWFGFAPQAWVIPLVVAAPFAARRLWAEALWILGTQVASLVTIAIKDLVHRARPSPELVGVFRPLSDPSFPSGHVVQYTMLFGFTFFLVYVLLQQSRVRTVALILLVIPIVLVGPSRIYLGQHWPTDVLGGYALSVLLLVPYCWAYTKWRLDAARSRFSVAAP
jgi:membrane-associated phospholipid phosphatase